MWVAKWHKKDGDIVAVDEPICELETDMAIVDLPSPAAGVLRHLVEAGERVPLHSFHLVARVDPLP